jgi:hypothetical protein
MPASIFNGTAVKLLKNILKFKDGTTLSSTIAGYLSNLTSDVQAQLNNKSAVDNERTVIWNETDFATLQAGIDYCETLAASAQADTTGVTLILPSRNFLEDVIIRKNVSLRGEGNARVQKITFRPTSAVAGPEANKLSNLNINTLEAYAETAAASGIFNPDFLAGTSLKVENCKLFLGTFNRVFQMQFFNCDFTGGAFTATYCSDVFFVNCIVGSIEWHVNDAASNLPTDYAGGNLQFQNCWVPGTIDLFKDGGSITAYFAAKNTYLYDVIMNGDCEVTAEGSRIATITRLNSNNTFINNEEYGLYKPTTPGDWDVEPEKVNEALDELAGRIGTGDFKADGSVPMTEQLVTVAGDSTEPAIAPTGDSNTGIYFPAANTIGLTTNGVEKHRIDSTGQQHSVVPGDTLLLPAYQARAWGVADSVNLSDVSGTYSRTGTTVTVTVTGHNVLVGHAVYADFTSGTAVDGLFECTAVTDANTFTFTHGTSGSTSGNITLKRATIKASGNISTIARSGTGELIWNFTTAMPDAFYCAQCTASIGAGRVMALWNNSSSGTTDPTAGMTTKYVSTIVFGGGSAQDHTRQCLTVFR